MSVSDHPICQWVESRLGLITLWDRITGGTVENKGALLRTSGFACFVLVLVECITGIFLSVAYTPSTQSAYKSIVTIEANPFGHFLRGLHHFGSAALIILSILTLIRMFFGGEYKGRRDVIWLATLVFLHLALFFQLTGHLLPWDTNAASTAEVEAGIANNVWVVGPMIKRFLLGGSSTGGATLARWYGFHIGLLPLILLLKVGWPVLMRRLRESRDEEPEPETTDRSPYFPVHMGREVLAGLAVFAVVAVMAWFIGAPLEKEATADNLNGYKAMSEWYVLPLHALTLVPPFNSVSFEPVATFVLPGALITLLFLLPFVDRNTKRALRDRPIAKISGIIVILSIVGLYAFALITERPHPEPPTGAPQIANVDQVLVTKGIALYKSNGCDACHAINGVGGKSAPDLSKVGRTQSDREWQVAHLIKPDSKVKGSTMPAYAQLKPEELKALAEYMVSLK